MSVPVFSCQYPVRFSGNWVLATGNCFLSRPGGFADEGDLGGTNRLTIKSGSHQLRRDFQSSQQLRVSGRRELRIHGLFAFSISRKCHPLSAPALLIRKSSFRRWTAARLRAARWGCAPQRGGNGTRWSAGCGAPSAAADRQGRGQSIRSLRFRAAASLAAQNFFQAMLGMWRILPAADPQQPIQLDSGGGGGLRIESIAGIHEHAEFPAPGGCGQCG